ncbi:hypothetical protein, partial [Pseudomonas asplenii]|uniref:hypothetical protein n=1 Tax=Pseudomonas asplenii TaxID=53407 RepID=UPI001E58D5D0
PQILGLNVGTMDRLQTSGWDFLGNFTQGKGSCLVGAKWAEAASHKRQLSIHSSRSSRAEIGPYLPYVFTAKKAGDVVLHTLGRARTPSPSTR